MYSRWLEITIDEFHALQFTEDRNVLVRSTHVYQSVYHSQFATFFKKVFNCLVRVDFTNLS